MSVRGTTVRGLSLADISKEVEISNGNFSVRGVLWSISYEQNWNDVTSIRDRYPKREPAVTGVTLDVNGWQSPELPLDTPVFIWDN